MTPHQNPATAGPVDPPVENSAKNKGPHRSPVPRLLRSTLTRLERTRPELTARVAAYWWFRPPAPPRPRRRRRHVPSGGWPVQWQLPGIGRVRGVEFGPEEGPVALLVHGWGGWWQQLAAHIEPLAQQGFRVIAFDCPGHGDSGPGRYGRRASTVPDMAEAIAAVAAAVGRVRVIVTHSLGTMATVRSITAHGLQVDATVTIAPATTAAPALSTFLSALGLGDATRQRLVPLLESRIGMPITTCDIPPVAAALTAGRVRPLLAIHDRDDPHISATEAEALVAVWPGAELMLTRALGHHRVLWDSAVVGRVAEFAAEYRS